MFVLRHDQMEKLRQVPIDVANRKLCQYARIRFPDHFAATQDKQLLVFVSAIRDKAQTYGIVNENDVATVLDLTVMYSPEFYTEPWAADIFSLVHLSGQEKMEMLRCRVRTTEADL